MDYAAFIEAISELNKTSYGFGNDVLYSMAADPASLSNAKQLAGAMWLIGRAYAASPQRRSYNGKCVVKTADDGRDLFFEQIAQTLVNDHADDCVRFLAPDGYAYNSGEEDIKRLAESVRAVLAFNLALCQALETFDEAATGVYCNNHISFCSKFLHFYFPHRVFIIDQFAFDGGKSLFNGNGSNRLRYVDTFKDRCLTEEVYQHLCSQEVKAIVRTCIESCIKACKDLVRKYQARVEKDTYKYENYIEHVARSYALGCILTEQKIVPHNQLAGGELASMPRLADTVFLNIKKKTASHK